MWLCARLSSSLSPALCVSFSILVSFSYPSLPLITVPLRLLFSSNLSFQVAERQNWQEFSPGPGMVPPLLKPQSDNNKWYLPKSYKHTNCSLLHCLVMSFSMNGLFQRQTEREEEKQTVYSHKIESGSLLKLWKQRTSLKFDLRTHLTLMGVHGILGPCWTLSWGSQWERKQKVKDVAVWHGQGIKCFT